MRFSCRPSCTFSGGQALLQQLDGVSPSLFSGLDEPRDRRAVIELLVLFFSQSEEVTPHLDTHTQAHTLQDCNGSTSETCLTLLLPLAAISPFDSRQHLAGPLLSRHMFVQVDSVCNLFADTDLRLRFCVS